MTANFDIIIIDAGIAGTSAAAELVAAGKSVALLEMESQPGYHSTGRSAAILAQTYGNSVIRKLTRASEGFFNRPPSGFTDHSLLSPRAILQIARTDQAGRLRQLFEDTNESGVLEWLEEDALARVAPHLKPGYAICGCINRTAQDLDVDALLQGYLRKFRKGGGALKTGLTVSSLRLEGSKWKIETRQGELTATTVVNAAGAWAGEIGKLAGAMDMPITPLRRTAVVFDAPDGIDVSRLPMVVDGDEEFYLKPEAGRLMASPADEAPSPACDAQPEELDIAICIDRIKTAFDFDVRRIHSKWAGLRSFLPDRTPACGPDPNFPSFFWLAGQGGFGVQTAPAMARLACSMLTGSPLDAELAATGFELHSILPSRLKNRIQI